MQRYWLLIIFPIALLVWVVLPPPPSQVVFQPRPVAKVETLMQGVFVAARSAMVQLQSTSTSSDGALLYKGRASAFVFHPDGYALTAYHAVEDIDTLEALTTKQEFLAARVLGFDESRDLAVIKISASRPLEYVELEFESEAKINDLLVEIGNSGNDFIQPRYGQVQGFIRADDLLVPTRLMLSNVYISPGDSGGAVIGFSGKAIGLGIGYSQGQNSRISYLVPLFGLAPWIEQMKKGARLRLPSLGFRVSQDNGAGLVVDEIIENSPAAKADLSFSARREMRLLRLENTTLRSLRDYHRVIRAKKVGDSLAVRVQYRGRIQDLSLRLE